jgi:hypothetical protein
MLAPPRLTTLGHGGVAARAAKVGLGHYCNSIYRFPTFDIDYDNNKFEFFFLRASSETSIPPVRKKMQKLKQGRYIATYICTGTVLDLRADNKVSLMAHGFHGLENQ